MVNSKIKYLLKALGQIFIALFILINIQGCEKSKVQDKKIQREILTSSILGFAYLQELNLEQAEAEFMHLIELDPDKSTGYASLGIVYLRMEKYDEAELQLLKAKEIDPENANIRILLSEAYTFKNDEAKSLNELREALEFDPENTEVIYLLSVNYANSEKTENSEEREKYLKQLTKLLPANIVPKLDLVTLLLHNNIYDQALSILEDINTIYPEFPKEAVQYFQQAVDYLNSNTPELASRQVQTFYNYIKITTPYQVGLKELTGQEGAMAGFPLISFDQSGIDDPDGSEVNILEVIKFKDITNLVGLPEGAGESNPVYGSLAVEDFDQDGDVDIYFSGYIPEANETKPFLLQNDPGNFMDISENSGILHQGKELSASFADFDNDGHIDLYVVKEDGNIMYQNSGNGSFVIVPEGKIPANNGRGGKAVFFDADHDGDLDIYLLKSGRNQYLRNNSDGTFSDLPDTFKDPDTPSSDAVIGDFDGDGDIDLFVTNTDTTNILYSNLRSGHFENVTDKSGLSSAKGWNSAAAGDYNNDGFIDLFMTGRNGRYAFMTNNGEGKFSVNTQSENEFALTGVAGHDAALFDFDNDGYLDLIVAGSNPGGKGVFLFHNNGSGKFKDVSHLLPENIVSGKEIAIADYNNDGDLDIFLYGSDGGIRLLRNDGGNTNHYLKIKLVGLRTGSRKNNYFGIGAKVEIRAGSLYEMTTATGSEIHFGIGKEAKAEVVRIIWNNGVPQNIYFPAGDQFLIEQQLLKGSCPFLYTWNGTRYEFVKDMMWRSALGMPLGIMGGDTQYAFADPSREYLKIPGKMLQPKEGVYSLQITKELWETIYFDKLELMAVDHPKVVDIFVDEKFTPPPFPEFRIYTTNKKHLPVTAFDELGNDVLPAIQKKDDRYVSNLYPAKYQGLTSLHSLILDPGKNPDTDILALNGWIFPTDASINFSISQSSDMEVVPPRMQVINREGEWETVIESIGFPLGKNKTMVIDLKDKFITEDHRVRIETNMQIYWDYAFFTGDKSLPVKTQKLEMISADLHFRGYSAMYRKGGRYGPHWFDYNSLSTGQKWRDLEGNYTRFGNVLALLQEADDQYIIANAGDEVTVEFDANLPDLPEGWTRDFVIYSEGWVKDGDMNTATGNTVLPLPFHGMSSYPYGPDEQYPDDSVHNIYNKIYNTRKITTDPFRNMIIDYKSTDF